MSSARQASGAPVLFENGTLFFFVTADCDYYVFDSAATDHFGWDSVTTGRLEGAVRSDLDEHLFAVPWPDGEEQYETSLTDGGTFTVWRRGLAASACAGDCPRGSVELRYLRDTSLLWIERLSIEGTPMQGPIRMAAYRDADLDAAPASEWDGELVLASIPYDPNSWGGSALVSDVDDIARLRAFRERLLAGDIGFRDPALLPLRQGGAIYRTWFRDALPFETSTGIVLPPVDP